MTKLKKNGNLPVNARINIEYGIKPKISFSYPDKKNQVRGSMFNSLQLISLSFGGIILFLLYLFKIRLISSIFPKETILGASILFLAFFYFVLTSIIYFPFKKQWDKLYPRYQAFITSKKLRVFYPKYIIKRDGRIFVELPIFSNIVCDFKCKGDFSDYLEEIDIREYKFTSLKLKRIGKIKPSKKQKRKRIVNEFIWYARWYFKKEPKKGKMEVIFK